MRNKIFCLWFYLEVITIGYSIAQSHVPTINLTTYSGTWIYKTDSTIFQIHLKQGTFELEKYHGECLIGDYAYMRNGSYLDNYNATNIPAIYTKNNFDSIVIHAVNQRNADNEPQPNCLNIMFYDKRMGKRSLGHITRLSSTQIHLLLFDVEGEYDNEQDIPIEGFSIPNNITLTKTRKILSKTPK